MKFERTTERANTMNHIYNVAPVECQPQWPVKNNKPKPSPLSKLVIVVGYSMFAVIGVGICLLGVFSMTGTP